MKKYIMAVLISLSALQVVALVTLKKDPVYRDARRNGAQTKIELHIQDDDGTPVPDAKIKAYLGMNFRPLGTWINGTTDTNGVFVLEGKTCGDEIEVFVAKDGYYGSHVIYRYAKMGEERDVKDGKWQPYGAAEKLILRRIVNPVLTSVGGQFVHTQRLNEWIGYDLEKRDFVQPYGKGEIADFEVFFDWDGKWLPDYTGMGKEIRFTDKFSGYYQCPVNAVSEFKGPYTAFPDATYQQDADFYERVIIDPNAYGRRYERKVFDKNKCWVVRSRCKVDAEGNLVSAHYSVINNITFGCDKGGIACICVKGAFNPTPNDINLEDAEIAKQSRHFIRNCEPPGKGNLKTWGQTP